MVSSPLFSLSSAASIWPVRRMARKWNWASSSRFSAGRVTLSSGVTWMVCVLPIGVHSPFTTFESDTRYSPGGTSGRALHQPLPPPTALARRSHVTRCRPLRAGCLILRITSPLGSVMEMAMNGSSVWSSRSSRSQSG